MEILLCQEREFKIDNQPSTYNKMDGQSINKVNWKRQSTKMNQLNLLKKKS